MVWAAWTAIAAVNDFIWHGDARVLVAVITFFLGGVVLTGRLAPIRVWLRRAMSEREAARGRPYPLWMKVGAPLLALLFVSNTLGLTDLRWEAMLPGGHRARVKIAWSSDEGPDSAPAFAEAADVALWNGRLPATIGLIRRAAVGTRLLADGTEVRIVSMDVRAQRAAIEVLSGPSSGWRGWIAPGLLR